MKRKIIIIVLFNMINILFIREVLRTIFATETELIFPNKWKIYCVCVILFVGWVFLYSIIYKNLNKYLYIFSFIVCLGVITLYSEYIITYQDDLNLKNARLLVHKFEKGEEIEDTYYWLGLSTSQFYFQKKDKDTIALVFKGKKGYFHRYDFKFKQWSITD